MRTAQGLHRVASSAFWGLRVIRGHLDSEPEVRLIRMDEPLAMFGGVKIQVQMFCLSKCIYGKKTFERTRDLVGSNQSKGTKTLSSFLLERSQTLLASGRARQSAVRSPTPAQKVREGHQASQHLITMAPCRCSRGIQWKTKERQTGSTK